MSDNSKIYEVMNIQSTVHTTSSSFNIQVSDQNYSLNFGTNSAQSSTAQLSISIFDQDVSQAIGNTNLIFYSQTNFIRFIEK